MLKSRNLIQPEDFSVREIDEILNLAEEIMKNPSAYSRVCEGKLMATLFYEPSTRTRLSFEAAMKRLGGEIIGFSEPNSSSVSKGESLADTMRVVSGYVDVIVMRHPIAGAAEEAINYTSVPFINAGDGGNQHPTQTLTDLLTIKSLKGSLENHTIGLCGDLKNGRTVHSLIEALVRYEGVKFVLISPEELRIPDYIREDVLKASGHEFIEVERLEEAMPSLDLLYMTRVQRERFTDLMEYERVKNIYILRNKMLENTRPNLRILHPLPRVNEIAYDVDDNPKAYYFQQAQNGLYAREAILCDVLGITLEDVKNDILL